MTPKETEIMAEPDNIQAFNEIVGQALVKLYSNFPCKITFAPADLIGLKLGEDMCDGSPIPAIKISDSSETSVTYKELDVVVDTLSWLREAGYIVYSGNNGHHYFESVTLTTKGLELLKAVPSSLDSEQSVGSHLQEVVESGSKQAVGELVSKALTQGYVMLQNAVVTGVT